MNNMSVFTESKAFNLAETSNPAYMVIEFIVANDQHNLNGEKLTRAGLEANAQSLVDMPIQVDRYRLERGLYSSLTHRAEKDGLKTDSVGVITKVWLETNKDTDVTTMYASAKIWKRYVKTCEALAEMYAEDNLKFSWELVSMNWITAEDGTREHNEFYFMGHCIVSMPSYPIAKAQLLVAELEQNSEQQSEVTGLEENLIADTIETVSDDVVEVVAETVEVEAETELVSEEEVVETVAEKDTTVVEAEEVTEEKEVEAEDKTLAYAEAIVALTEKVSVLQAQVAELEPYRLEAVRVAEEKAQAEIVANKAKLKGMAVKVVAELTAEMNDAIEAQDEKGLKILIADYAIANVKESTSVVEDIVIATKDEEYAIVVKDKLILY